MADGTGPGSVPLARGEVEQVVCELNAWAERCAQDGDRERAGRLRRLAREIRRRLESAITKHQHDNPVHPAVIVRGKQPMAPTGDGSTVIHVPAGIGDLAWMVKLRHLTKLNDRPVVIKPSGEQPRRAQQFVELVPGLTFGGWSDRGSGEILEVMRRYVTPTAAEMVGRELCLAINGHAESGLPIDEFVPGIPHQWDLELATTTEHRRRAAEVIGAHQGLVVALYPAAHGPVRHWGFWDAADWARMARAVYDVARCRFVVLGAGFDAVPDQRGAKAIAVDLVDRLRDQRIPVSACLGEHFGVAYEVMQRSHLLLAFPSGIPIVGTMSGVKTVWWLPDKETRDGNINKLVGWIHPDWITHGRIETRAFEDVAQGIAAVLESAPFQLMMAGRKR